MVFNAYHNSQDLLYRAPFGAVACGQRITLRLKTVSALPVTACVLRLWAAGRELRIPMQPEEEHAQNPAATSESEQSFAYEGLYKGEYAGFSTSGLVWYYFVIQAGARQYYYGNNDRRLGGEGGLWEHEPPAYQITVYQPLTIPEWYQRGVMYQIYVDRFFRPGTGSPAFYARANALIHACWSDRPLYIKDEAGRVTDWDFFGGTLQGVLEKLPYFREMGITILYFNPIFEAPSNHKYDTADYHRIDPMYGDDTVFKQLIAKAGEYGISIILDGVFSHTGSDSIYFNKYGNYPGLGAYQSLDSPYYAWYRFGANREEYKCWWGIDSLPEVDELNPSYRQFIYGGDDSVLHKWLNMGVAGWRLDVADELPDEFIQELRLAMKRIRPDAVLIGEVWEDASNKISYGQQRAYFLGHELDATMNYPFRAIFLGFLLGQSDSRSVHQAVMSLYENYPRENFYAAMNLIGSHDTARILTLLGEAPPEQELIETERRNFRLPPLARQLAVQRLKMFSLLQMTFPGVPCIYYGDEAGVEGYTDPYNRGTFPWGEEDREIRQWYQRLLRLHAEYEVVQTGDFRSLFCAPDVYGFVRSGNEEEIIILLNRHPVETKTINLRTEVRTLPWVADLITGEQLAPETLSALPISALSARALLGKKTLPQRAPLYRSCGILFHISSLPSGWGGGDFGQAAYDFVDFLAEAGQSLWQVLPLNPTGLGDSPYQSESVFAGNPEFISLDHLIREGLLNSAQTRAKHEQLRRLGLEPGAGSRAFKALKRELLRAAYREFQRRLANNPLASSGSGNSTYLTHANFLHFQNEHQGWLEDYVLFRALKAHFGDVPWYDWAPEIAAREPEALAEYALLLSEEMGFGRFLQYTFFYEWHELKTYAKAKGVQLIGDLPHFAAADSCDVWSNRNLFVLDERGRPVKVAGVPPDYFSRTGQLWGNPVYDWDALADTGYAWWKRRIRCSCEQFDFIRLDHFRGFEAFWEVDAGDTTAENGRWIKGPGKRFFESIMESLPAASGHSPIIVEDLGMITPEVNVLKHIFGFPGMKVLQFTPLKVMSGNSDAHYVYYSGTHDNNTLLGWYEEQEQGGNPVNNSVNARERSRQACRALLEELYLSPAVWVILPMQDILGLGEEARMNVPGTTAGNWQWRLDESLALDEVKIWLRTLAEQAQRVIPLVND